MGYCAFLGASHVSAKPLVLSSLKPLTLIAQEITGTTADIDTLIPTTASHHDYPLKTSDYTRMQKADIVLWIGPELESFLQKPTANLPAAKLITAYRLEGMNWPAEHYSAQAHNHSHEHDPHLWLDPRNAIIIAKALTTKLSEIDKAEELQYAANLRGFSSRMTALDSELQKSMKPLTGRGFAVYHEGFAHFVSHYGLRQLDFVALTPEQKPGAKHLLKLRELLAKEGHCLFLEPYNDMRPTQSLALELHLKIGELDALGVRNPSSYAQLLERLAEDFSACLTGSRRGGEAGL